MIDQIIIAALLLSSAAFVYLHFSQPKAAQPDLLPLGSVLCFVSLALILIIDLGPGNSQETQAPVSPAPVSQALPQTLPETLADWKALPPPQQQAVTVMLLKDLRQRQIFQQPIYRESDYLKWGQKLQVCLMQSQVQSLSKAAEGCLQRLGS